MIYESVSHKFDNYSKKQNLYREALLLFNIKNCIYHINEDMVKYYEKQKEKRQMDEEVDNTDILDSETMKKSSNNKGKESQKKRTKTKRKKQKK